MILPASIFRINMADGQESGQRLIAPSAARMPDAAGKHSSSPERLHRVMTGWLQALLSRQRTSQF
jgi:hypothetical protein